MAYQREWFILITSKFRWNGTAFRRPFLCWKLRGNRNNTLFCYPTIICVTMSYVWFSIVLTAETQTNAPWHTPLFSVGREYPNRKAEGRIEWRDDDGSLPKPSSNRHKSWQELTSQTLCREYRSIKTLRVVQENPTYHNNKIQLIEN